MSCYILEAMTAVAPYRPFWSLLRHQVLSAYFLTIIRALFVRRKRAARARARADGVCQRYRQSIVRRRLGT
jgi:hypothetical protein